MRKKSKLFLVFSIYTLSIITFLISVKSSKLDQLILDTENFLKSQAEKISQNFNNRCALIENKQCFSGKLYTPQTLNSANSTATDIKNRFLEEATSTAPISSLSASSSSEVSETISQNNNFNEENNCILSSCNSKAANSKDLRCLNNFEIKSTENKDSFYDTNDYSKNAEICNFNKLLVNKSTVKFSSMYYPITDSNSNDVKEVICATQFLDNEFKKLYSINNYVSWQAFGSANGVLRRFPGGLDCTSDDHRRRSWYEQASRKPMNIVFAVDFSGLSNNGGKSKLLVRTLTTLINNFDSTIWTGIIPLSSPLNENYFSGNLISANEKNKEDLVNLIKNAEFKGDMKFSLNKIKNYLLNSKKMKIGSNCEDSKEEKTLSNTVVIYLFGNDVSSFNEEATTNSSSDVSSNEELNSVSYNSIYLNFGTKDNSFLLKKQCEEMSLYTDIQTPTDIEASVTSILNFISLGTKRSEPVWNRYSDTYGLGEILTGSIPVYSGDELIGVYASDILVEKVQKAGLSTDIEFDLSFYTLKGGNCLNQLPVSDCALEKIRPKKCFGDSKSFDAKCQEELSKSNLKSCSAEILKNNYEKFYCSTAEDEYKYNFTNKNTVNCCLSAEEKIRSISMEMALLDSSSKSSSDASNTSSKNSSSSSSTDNVDSLITPLDSSSTNSTSISSDNSTIKIDSNKNKPVDSDSDLYILIILVVVVVGFVMWYMKKNEPKPYLNISTNRELGQLMNQTTRSNYYQ